MLDSWTYVAALVLFAGYAFVGNGEASSMFLVGAGVWRIVVRSHEQEAEK